MEAPAFGFSFPQKAKRRSRENREAALSYPATDPLSGVLPTSLGVRDWANCLRPAKKKQWLLLRRH
jgi:hypothetical protein